MQRFNDSDINRLLKVLDGRIPDRIPYLDFLFSKKIMQNTLGRNIDYKVTTRADSSTKIDIDSKDFIDFIYSIGQDLAGFLILAPDTYSLKDGGKITKCIDIIDKIELYKKIEYPVFKDFILEYQERYESMEKESRRLNIGLTMLTGAIFQDSHQLMGFDNLMFKIYDDIPFIEKIMDFFTDIYYEVARFICSYDVSLFFYTDNIAYNNGPFFKPELFKNLYLPRLKKVLQPAFDKGLPIIFDSDGDIEWLIEDLIHMGINAIHPIDPGGMNIYKIKEKYGEKITIMGNVGQDFPLSSGSKNDVEKDVKKRIALLGRGGKYVLKSSHDVGDNVKVENFIAMIKTLHEYGYY